MAKMYLLHPDNTWSDCGYFGKDGVECTADNPPFEAPEGCSWHDGEPPEGMEAFRVKSQMELIREAYEQLPQASQIKYGPSIEYGAFFFERNNMLMVQDTFAKAPAPEGQAETAFIAGIQQMLGL